MNKYDIVFCDIDDTLNPSNGTTTEYTREVMKKLKDKGIKVVVNTGRSAKYAVEKSIEAGLSEYIISSNGAEVYNYHERKEIFSKPISKEDILAIYDYCVTHNMTIILNCLEKRYINIKDYKYNNEPAIYFEDINENRADFGNDIGNFFFDLEVEEEGRELSIKNNSIVTNIENLGDAETPIKVVFKARTVIKNPSIYNVYTKEFIKLNYTMQEGEEITVTTHHGNKRVESYLNGVTKNIFNDLDINSTFMWLDVGDNVIRYDSDTMIEQLEVYIYYTNYYLGV